MHIRRATPADAEGMGNVMQRLTAAGMRRKPADAAYALTHYISHVDQGACYIAINADGQIIGFQSLKHATKGNVYGVTAGWGIIGTHVAPNAHGQGAGRALFAVTRDAARELALKDIDATIGADNKMGLAYYDAMGFRTYRTYGDAICKRFTVT